MNKAMDECCLHEQYGIKVKQHFEMVNWTTMYCHRSIQSALIPCLYRVKSSRSRSGSRNFILFKHSIWIAIWIILIRKLGAYLCNNDLIFWITIQIFFSLCKQGNKVLKANLNPLQTHSHTCYTLHALHVHFLCIMHLYLSLVGTHFFTSQISRNT